MGIGKVEINRGAPSSIGQSGIGFVVVPDENNRLDYIEDCYRTSTVTINGGYGCGYISAVRVVEGVMPLIKFPMSSEERGSAVFWVRENFNNRPIIVGVIPIDGLANLLIDGQQRIVQQFGEITVEMFFDANTSTINIVANGSDDLPANIVIKANSGNTNSNISLETDGKVNVTANRIETTLSEALSFSLKSEDNEELLSLIADKDNVKFSDQYGNAITVNENNINVTVKNKFNVNSGKEPMVLGQTLVDLLNEILDAIKQITVITPVGTSSVPVNIASFASAQQKLKNILSTISNLD